MKRADLTLFIDGAGAEHVAVVTDQNPDGTVDLAVLKPTLRNVPRSAIGTPHSAFDIDAPREELPPEETVEVAEKPMRQFVEGEDGKLLEVEPLPTAHGAPTEITDAVPQTSDQGPVSGG